MAGVTIGPLWFKSKAEAVRYTRKVLWDLPLGDIPDEHLHFVWALLKLHKNAAQKIGTGAKMIEIRVNQPYGSRGFWVVRHDGSETDFSYKECLMPSTTRLDITLAMRSEVSHQIVSFRDAALRRVPVCEITGRPIERDDCEVDHVPPNTFARLVDAFLGAEGIELKDIRTQDGDARVKAGLQDRLLASKWQDFHRKTAQLRLLSRAGHRIVTRPGAA